MNVAHPVSYTLSSVKFGFLSADEIRSLSVKRIWNPTTFDSLLHPTPGGLYDTALGAFFDNPCSTCHLNKIGCPGHCGHIELPVPVYHPTFMDQCLRLLRATCIHCHHLKMSRVEVNRFYCKLRLLHHGLVTEAQHIEQLHLRPKTLSADLTNGDDENESDASEGGNDIINRRLAYVRQAINSAEKTEQTLQWTNEKNESISEERRAVIKEFLGDITKGKKCANCKGISPAYRKDRFVKIFKQPLSDRDRAANIQGGFHPENPLLLLMRKRKAATKKQPNGIHVDEAVADLEEGEQESEDISLQDADEIIAGDDIVSVEATARDSAKSAKSADAKREFISAGEVLAALSHLFEAEQEILKLVYCPENSEKVKLNITPDMFFIHNLLVPPTKYRPEVRKDDEEVNEAQSHALYKQILSLCELLNQVTKEIDGTADSILQRRRGYDELQSACLRLQDAVNSLIDSDRNPMKPRGAQKVEQGIKQKLEKKEGLFRSNLMGKRVNFAARSVISPDPNLETNEIGVPPVFAKKLTYPEPVTNHNFYELKEAVLSGPDRWPGATAIENENGQVINLKKKNYEERLALANQLLAPSSMHVNGARNKKVHRHLNNGDVVLMNRQPTLHKPSIMAHRARILPGEKTIRMHYANCNTYNADFDGDEMNMHFPQNELARAEAVTIADTDHQYLSATAGEPLRGLIQDHISIAVSLTNRDTFFSRDDYQQLLYSCLRPENGHTASGRLETVGPAILKPKPMWTGKQVITSILKNITPKSHPGLTLASSSQTLASEWGTGSEEQTVLFSDGYLICGILDKKQIGSKGGGFINGVYETYGHVIAGRLLSVLGRLLTRLLQMFAFSCGIEDLVLTEAGERNRREKLNETDRIGIDVAAEYVSLKETDPKHLKSLLRERLEEVMRDDSKQRGLEALTNTRTMLLSSEVTKACLPDNLLKLFPKNQMQTMTGSGAKGSQVNANLISCNLGQQVLEGRRVPIMVSGKTLPCFKPFETNVRAGGYVTNRFLTGIRPQEYYFHAMAGREGLIDTAVKTSRSGYLQRCLMKGLEGLKVDYDTSVRDSDGTIIQFLYGEDGLDATKQKYLTNFKFLAQNFYSLYHSLGIREDFIKIQSDDALAWNKSAIKKLSKTGDLAIKDPALSVFAPSRFAGSTSEKFYIARKKYCEENKDKLIMSKKDSIEGVTRRKDFESILDVKYLKSVVEAGESVGVVAAQSVGEPSTQMTLNTFHLAGHAAKNVTLGIPRLREIVMTASAAIKTPTMTLHLNPEISEESATQFAKGISSLALAETVDSVTVRERIGRGVAYEEAKSYRVRLDFYPAEEYCKEYGIKVDDVVRAIEVKFLRSLQKLIRSELKKKGSEAVLKSAAKSDALPDIGKSAGTVEVARTRPEAEREGGNDDSEDDEDGDATNAKRRANRAESVTYDDPDEEEQAILDQQVRESSSESEEEDETYGGSPRRASPASSADDSESDDEARAWKEKTSGLEERIKKENRDVTSFTFDKSGSWCEFTLEYDVKTAKILVLHFVESALRSSVVQAIPGLSSCVTSTEKRTDPDTDSEVTETVVLTQGANLLAMREYQNVINPHRLMTNDIAAMLRLYGVEACRACIVNEMRAVFEGHAISVDARHLGLIADAMTRGGGFKAFSRNGMKSSVSPFTKMSFETTVNFLKDAVLEGDWDDLKSPSARLVVGKLGKVGTGAFDVLLPFSSMQ